MMGGGFGVCGSREVFCFTWVTQAFAVKIGRLENVKEESNCGCHMWEDPFGAALHLWSTISFSLPPQFKRFQNLLMVEIHTKVIGIIKQYCFIILSFSIFYGHADADGLACKYM